MSFRYRPRLPGAVAGRMIELQVEGLRQYADLVASGFGHVLNQMDREANRLPRTQRDEYFEWYYDQLAMARDEGPQILNGALMISLYTVLERGLVGFCAIAHRAKPSSRKFRPLPKESKIGAARRYLKKDLHYRVLDGAEWRRIDRFRYIRNCLVHDMGKITKKTGKPTIRAVQNTPGVTRSSNGYLIFEPTAVGQFADDIVSYCSRVATAIDKKGQRGQV